MSEVEFVGFTNLLQHLAVLQRRLLVPDSLNWNVAHFIEELRWISRSLLGEVSGRGDSP